jgi:hypothetical protein
MRAERAKQNRLLKAQSDCLRIFQPVIWTEQVIRNIVEHAYNAGWIECERQSKKRKPKPKLNPKKGT